MRSNARSILSLSLLDSATRRDCSIRYVLRHSRRFRLTGGAALLITVTAWNPLSLAGSLNGEGGRFNIGSDLSPGSFTAFPALYIAEDYETAFRERFGNFAAVKPDGLTLLEVALRSPDSFTQVRLRGLFENVVDVGNLDALKPFVSILREFPVPRGVRQAARRLGLSPPPWLVRSPVNLQRQLVHPNWRMLPQQFDLPSNSQIFGRIAVAAGLHGIRYPSARQHGKVCLALFPQNWADGGSIVEVTDPAPPGARLTKIDGKTKEVT